MGRSRAAKWVQLYIGAIILGVLAVAVWGIYEDRFSTAPGGGGPARVVSGGSATASAKLVILDKIGALRLVNAEQGRQAVININKMHGTNIGVEAGYIANYTGGGYQATLWVAGTANPTDAKRLTDLMAEKIRPGNAYFTNLQELQREDKVIYTVDGGGQKHYYYQASEKVVWLAVSGPNHESVLQDLLSLIG